MKRITFIITLFSMLLPACQKDFLEFEPYGQPSNLGAMTDEQAMQVVYSLYEWQYSEGTTGRGLYWLENASDNLITGRTQAEAANIKNFIDFDGSSATARAGSDGASTWPKMYQTIARANSIISQVPGTTTISEGIKNLTLGNAYFWRGFSYLWLAPWYGDNGPNGGIPIIDENTPVEEIDQPRPSSVLDNYNMIIADLEKAAEYLPLFSEMPAEQYGLTHRTAAWAFAARAALYASQYDASYLDDVIRFADLVINARINSLEPNYQDIFEIDHNFGSEYIYSVASTNENGSKWPGISFQNAGFGIYNTWGYFQPTKELYDAFEPGDKRLKTTLVLPGDTVDFVGNQIVWEINPATTSSPSGMTMGKWLAPFRGADAIGTRVNPSGNNMTTDLHIGLIRYSDVLLMKAEALIWKNGDGDAVATEILNDIRERAGLPRDSRATKAQLKKERRCELAFEWGAWRFQDIIRWGDGAELLTAPLHGFNDPSGADPSSWEVYEVWPARNFDPSKHHVFAIPVDQLETSENLVQNQY